MSTAKLATHFAAILAASLIMATAATTRCQETKEKQDAPAPTPRSKNGKKLFAQGKGCAWRAYFLREFLPTARAWRIWLRKTKWRKTSRGNR